MKRIVIILIVSLLLSCERDNESPGSNLNTFISVDPNDWWIDNGDYFYFVTTLDGELIAFKKLEDHSFLFAFLKKDQQYYYKYFFDLNPDENYSFELDPATMDTDFDIQLLNAPVEMFFLEDCEIKNVILDKLCYYSYCRLYSEINGDSTTLSIFNTAISTGKYFHSRIHLQVKDSKEYIYLKNGNLPEFIPPLDFDISASSLEYDNISITTTGSFDFINGYYRGENYPYKSWSFISDNPDFIKFPDIPAEITELYPSITIDTFFDTLTVEANISLIESSEYENYAEYLANFGYIRDLDENSALQNLLIKNYE